ncbi:MAG: Xylose isomerase domain protein barrel [Planctomycetaceae bacterium]|nr:Xylose isomerase domain protein barrel [Planctomycetaceae bacterium]
MFVAASTRCFSDYSFWDACRQLVDLEYEKIEIWLDENSEHLKPSEVAANPEGFLARYREHTRLTAVAFCLATDVDEATFTTLSKIAKQLRITQITLEASPLGTPFNAEIDRLKSFLKIGSQDGIRVSITTKTGKLTEDPRTAVELCQSTPGLGLTLDPSYYLCGPHKNVTYEPLFAYTYHVHLRDSTPEQLQVRIGLGEIDYSRMISQLERTDYKRALSVELLPEMMDPSHRPIELRKMRLLLESLL